MYTLNKERFMSYDFIFIICDIVIKSVVALL